MRLTLHKLRRRTTPPSKPSCFGWGGLGYQNNTAAWRNAEGRGRGGLDVMGQAGCAGGSRTDGLGWGGKKHRVRVCTVANQQQWLSRVSTKGKQPSCCTVCVAVGLFICQNVCTEMFQWREGKAASRSSAYCELQAEQLLPDVGSPLKAVINPPLYLFSVAFSPWAA